METPKDILIKKDKFFIRFFMWVWEIEEDALDQCRVFWGLVFFPVGLLFGEKFEKQKGKGFIAIRRTEGHFNNSC